MVTRESGADTGKVGRLGGVEDVEGDDRRGCQAHVRVQLGSAREAIVRWNHGLGAQGGCDRQRLSAVAAQRSQNIGGTLTIQGGTSTVPAPDLTASRWLTGDLVR